MYRRPPRSTRTATLLPFPTLFRSVATAMGIAMDQEGLSVSKRKITLSTSGVVPEMARCGRELDVNLAVSLHATTDEVRDHIMPINKKYPLKMLLDACRSYPGTHNARSEEHTSELQSLMRITYAVFCLKKKTMIELIKARTIKTL